MPMFILMSSIQVTETAGFDHALGNQEAQNNLTIKKSVYLPQQLLGGVLTKQLRLKCGEVVIPTQYFILWLYHMVSIPVGIENC